MGAEEKRGRKERGGEERRGKEEGEGKRREGRGNNKSKNSGITVNFLPMRMRMDEEGGEIVPSFLTSTP